MMRCRARAIGPAALLSVSCAVLGCHQDEGPPQALAPLPPGPPVERVDPYLRSPSRYGNVHLHAGFSPDPRVVEGVALGEVSARSIRKGCKGWVSERPDYLLVADTAFLQLYLISRARQPVSIVVRKPDGRIVCRNAKKGAVDTVLELDLPLGTSQLWMGVRTEGASAAYRLGLSEVSWRSTGISLPDK